ncbi:hypothetical protein NliqN6_6441 [Naganishia liquefaciens]|uniref:Vacuolar calcium ion transporter n=1 Tax=Naganishia liquefaciens TaxID=104408 RepID=A0A8H3YHM0_9TREE|nr:hypothetical protein NliqN6_6441 [Naganishia liquefaciens]
MSSNERQPLLPTRRRRSTANAGSSKKSFSPLQSTRHLLFGGWLNALLLSVPFALACNFVNWPQQIKFVISFISIIPLAKLLGDATEQLSMSLGQTLAGILNATFGNAVELIVGIVALQQDQLRLVQTSMLGSILSNLLLVLGCSFAAGGFVYSESQFRQTAAQTSASLMTLSCITLVIPAAYHSTYLRRDSKDGADSQLAQLLTGTENPEHAPNPKDDSLNGLLKLSRGTSIILLVLKSHAKLFEAEEAARGDGDDEEEEETEEMDTWSAGFWLAAITVVTAFCADVLVASIDETASKWHIPKPFIGMFQERALLILLPIVGNAAEHVTSVWMAMKGKMELTIGVSVGSSIQIAAGMIPILTLLAWPMGKPLTLYFADFETIALFASVILVSGLLNDGSSNYMEGVMLVALYLVIALSYAVS